LLDVGTVREIARAMTGPLPAIARGTNATGRQGLTRCQRLGSERNNPASEPGFVHGETITGIFFHCAQASLSGIEVAVTSEGVFARDRNAKQKYGVVNTRFG
jgi:hypothetical protein